MIARCPCLEAFLQGYDMCARCGSSSWTWFSTFLVSLAWDFGGYINRKSNFDIKCTIHYFCPTSIVTQNQRRLIRNGWRCRAWPIFCSCLRQSSSAIILINVQFAALCQHKVRNGCLCCCGDNDDEFTEITTMTTNNNTSNVLINALTTLAVAVVSNWALYKYHESGVGMLFNGFRQKFRVVSLTFRFGS